tara:strand:+ start:4367 stop:5362 length:996 start_codon:yes stop_codon:yes gene_type:complete
MQKKFLIVGSNSFTGSHFVNYCLNNNHKVIGISRSKEILDFYLPYKNNPKTKKNFFFYKLDLNKHLTKIVKVIKTTKPTHIVNFASQSMVAESWKTPIDWYKTNVISLVKLIENIKNFKFIKKYVHISTPEVYGNTKLNMSENTNYNPTTPYAISRACFDTHLMQICNNSGFPAVFTRAANVYGPGQQLYRIIPRSIYSCYTNKKLMLDGGGLSKRSFIYIDDVVNATYKISTMGKIGEIYHISTNELISILAVVKKIFSICKSNFKKKVIVGPERKGKDKLYSLSSQKLYKQFNWKAKVKIENGIQKTLEWFLKNKTELIKQKVYYKHKK